MGGGAAGGGDADDKDEDDASASNPFQKINPLLHGGIMAELAAAREKRLEELRRKRRRKARRPDVPTRRLRLR